MANSKTVTPTEKTTRNPKAAAASVATEVKDAVSSATDTAVAALHTARSHGEHMANSAIDAGGAAVQTGQDMVTSAHSDFAALVRKNPTAMVVGAVGVGVLLGLAMRKGS